MITERRFVSSRPSVYGKLYAPNRTNEVAIPINTENLQIFVDPGNPHCTAGGTTTSLTNLGLASTACSKGSGTVFNNNFLKGTWFNSGFDPQPAIFLGNPSSVEPSTEPITIFGWLWMQGGGFGNALTKSSLAGPSSVTWFYNVATGTSFQSIIGSGTGSTIFYFPTSSFANSWRFITQTFGGGNTHSLYFDGILRGTGTTNLPTASGQPWAFGTGNYFTAGTSLKGYMGMVGIYNRVLFASEINELYEQTRVIYGV